MEKYKCSPKYRWPLLAACYNGHFEVVQYLVKDCECYRVEDEYLVFDFLCNEVEVYLKWHEERYYISQRREKPMPRFVNECKRGDDHIKIMMFLLKNRIHMECENISTPILMLSLQLILLHGNYEHIVFLENNKLLTKSILTEWINSSTPLIEFAFFKNGNLSIIKQLISSGVITCDADLIITAWECSATEEILSLLVTKCSSNPMYVFLKHKHYYYYNNKDILIEHVTCCIMKKLNFANPFFLTTLLQCFGDTVDSQSQNILHHICNSRFGYSLAPVIVEQKPDLQKRRDINQQLPLHIACSKKAEHYPANHILDLVKVVSSACDINSCDKDGNTPLHIACLDYSNREIVKFLVFEMNASVMIRNNDGVVPLHKIYSWNLIFVDSHLLRSCDINVQDQCGNTLLHTACFRQNSKDIKHLVLNMNAIVHIANCKGQTPLHIVSQWWKCHCSDEMVESINLLTNNKTVTARDNDGNTPLHVACGTCGDSTRLVNHLTENIPASVSVYNDSEMLPIHLTLYWRRFISEFDSSLAKLLLQKIDVTLPDAEGNTPLHLACKCGDSGLILYLVQSRGAMTQVQNDKGELPLHLILISGCTKMHVIDLLISSQSLCIEDHEGNTPLHAIVQESVS